MMMPTGGGGARRNFGNLPAMTVVDLGIVPSVGTMASTAVSTDVDGLSPFRATVVPAATSGAHSTAVDDTGPQVCAIYEECWPVCSKSVALRPFLEEKNP